MRRRNFIKLGAITAFGGIINPSLVFSAKNEQKSCIFIYLHGGISQIETFSPIPDSGPEFRSITGYLNTNIPNMQIGGTFNKLSTLADKYSIVRSFGHRDNNHNSAQHEILTSHPSPQVLDGVPQKEPSYGSIISSIFNPNIITGLPSYIKLDRLTYDKPAWLGSKNSGYEPDGELESKISINKFKERYNIVTEIEKYNRIQDQSWSEIRSQAAQVITGNVCEAFRWDKEADSIINKYNAKNSIFCKNLLTARRLIEYGAKFISVVHYGWDMHNAIKNGFEKAGPEIDNGIATLIEELYERGLNQNCLVIVTSEFGRTSKLNNGFINGIQGEIGRDHQAGITPLLLSGGNYEHGRIIGQHDDRAMRPESKPITPQDLLATILNHFQVDPHIQRVDNSGRPRYLIDGGTCIL